MSVLKLDRDKKGDRRRRRSKNSSIAATVSSGEHFPEPPKMPSWAKDPDLGEKTLLGLRSGRQKIKLFDLMTIRSDLEIVFCCHKKTFLYPTSPSSATAPETSINVTISGPDDGSETRTIFTVIRIT